jgi:hypothetical protein
VDHGHGFHTEICHHDGQMESLLYGFVQEPGAEFVNDDETPGDVNLVSAVATFC